MRFITVAMTTDTTEIEAELLAEAHSSTYQNSGIDQVFRDFDATDVESASMKIPVPRNDTVPPEPIAAGETLPRNGESYENMDVRFDKFGLEVTDESSDDEIVEMVEQMFATIASQAANEVYDSVSAQYVNTDSRLEMVRDALFTATGSISYADVDTVLVTQVLGESIANADPTREWDEIADDISQKFDINVVTDEFNVLRAGDILVVNTDLFGYKCTRTELSTNAYVEYEEHAPHRDVFVPEDERVVEQSVAQLFTRVGYAVLNDDAAVLARFGTI